MSKRLKVLVACEESQAVCCAFRAIGHEAYSCDLQPCSGGHPEWHIQGDCLPILRQPWDILIAHPPCTFLTVTGNRWFNVEKYGETAKQREREREKAVDFFLEFTKTSIRHVAIENPIGCMSTRWRKADQIIQPYQFGHPARKSTCLWLSGLPPLQPTEIVKPEIYYYIAANGKRKSESRWRSQGKKSDWAKLRSKTFSGIAAAMAEQWSKYVLEQEG